MRQEFDELTNPLGLVFVEGVLTTLGLPTLEVVDLSLASGLDILARQNLVAYYSFAIVLGNLAVVTRHSRAWPKDRPESFPLS